MAQLHCTININNIECIKRLLSLFKLACNTCKCVVAFKIKHNFYYKNINNYSNYFLKKACNVCIHMDTFKIKHNFYHKI